MPLPNGAAIREIRQAKGWKAVTLASTVGISRSHLANIESPKERKGASVEILRKIADALKVPLTAITIDAAADNELDVYIRLIADAAPPLTDEQRDRLAALLRPTTSVAPAA
jgi:transcriptional regulator with XRE-family HTH domain